MSTETKILIVEHDADDIELLQHELKKSGITYISEVVQTEQDYGDALKKFIPDIILSDYSLPSFSGPLAFEMREKIAPDTPFIFVSGNIGEERSIEYIKNGLTDYVLKDKLFTLNTKIKRALEESKEKQEKNETEQLIIQNEKRFRALIEKSADMKTLSTHNGDLIYGSPSITRFLGYSLEEFLHKRVYDFIHPDDIPGLIENTNKILQTSGKSFYNQERLLHKNGNWVWCEGTVTNLLDEPGINALVSNFRDISEKKIAEKQSEFDKNNLNTLINNTSDLMWSVDRDFNLITSNQPFDEMGKVNFGKAIDKGSSILSAAYSPEMLSHFKQVYERAFAGEAFTETESFNFPVELWTEISCSPIRSEGEIIGVACHSRDITEKKKLEKSFEIERQRFYELFLDAPSSMGMLSGPNHVFEVVNPLYLELISKKDIIGKTVKEVLPEVVDQGFIGILDEVYKTGKTFSANEMLVKLDPLGNGKLVDRYLNFMYQAHRTNDNIDGILFFAVDVSEQVLSRKKIEDSEARLKEAQALSHISNWEIDLLTGVNTWSDEFYHILGINQEVQPSPEAFLSQIHPDDYSYAKRKVEETFVTSKGSFFYAKIKTANGTERYIFSEWRFEFDENKNPVRIYGILQDVTERKKTDETSLRLASIVESSRDAIISLSLDGSIMSWNHAAKILYDYSSKEVLGKPYSILFHPDSAQEFTKEIERFKIEKRVGRIEAKHTRKDGMPIHILASLSPIEDITGNLIGISANGHDISEQKRAEELVNQINSEGKDNWIKKIRLELGIYLLLGAMLFFCSFYFELPERFIYMIGANEDSFWEFWDDLFFLIAFMFMMAMVFAFRRFKESKNEGWIVQNAMKTLNSELEMRVQERTNELSKSNEVLLNEIIGRKKTEENLKQSEAHLTEAQRLAKMGSWNYEIKTDKLVWSEELYNVFDTDKQAFKETHGSFLHLIDAEDREFALQTSMHTQKTGEPFTIEYHINTLRGEKRVILEHGYGQKDDNGKVIRLFGTAQDITEQVLSQIEKERITDDIIQRNKDLEQFSYIVSHNLRAPVANIIGLCSIVQDENLNPDLKKEVMNGLSVSVEKLDDVIIDLNNILKLKSEANETKEVVLFSELVKDIQSSIKSLIKKENAVIVCDFSEVDEILTLKGYLQSIFYNLISNSLKYRRHDISPLIEIKSRRFNDKIELFFKDNGMGIDLSKKGDQIFGLYKRFHTESAEGKGMGLYMVKTQVETLGGKISLSSEVNKGTEFKIEFTT